MDKIHRLRNVNSHNQPLISSMIQELIDLANKYKRWDSKYRHRVTFSHTPTYTSRGRDEINNLLDLIDQASLMLTEQ